MTTKQVKEKYSHAKEVFDNWFTQLSRRAVVPLAGFCWYMVMDKYRGIEYKFDKIEKNTEAIHAHIEELHKNQESAVRRLSTDSVEINQIQYSIIGVKNQVITLYNTLGLKQEPIVPYSQTHAQ